MASAHAQLQGGGLEGGGGLGAGNGGLKAGGLQASGLDGARLKTSSIKSTKLEGAKPQQGAKRLNPATIKRKATELAEGGLGTKQLQGAASTIPRTQVGELLYDVASLLMMQGAEMKDVGIGYYMAVLADPQGERHDDALARLKEIFLDKELEHEEAVRLYDSGLETMKSLVSIKIGITDEGYRSGLLTLQEVKAAYHQRLAKEVDDEPKDSDMPKEPEEGTEEPAEAEEVKESGAPAESR